LSFSFHKTDYFNVHDYADLQSLLKEWTL